MKLPERINPTSKNLLIISPRAGDGWDTPFINELLDTFYLAGYSAITYNYSFFRDKPPGSEPTQPSPGFEKELEDLWTIYQKVGAKYPTQKIHLVGKSLGGIVSSWLPWKNGAQVASISILGFDINFLGQSVNPGNFPGPLFIVQGGNDSFGGEAEIRAHLANFNYTGKYEISIIPDTNHSYKKPDGTDMRQVAFDTLLKKLNLH